MIDLATEQAASTPATKKSSRRTDGSKFFTPEQIGSRWAWHPESVRRAIRERRIASIIISRRRLVAIAEVERIEFEGLIARAV